MASESFFLTKTTVANDAMLSVDGALAVESFETLSGILLERAGGTVASLFAEPVLSKGNGAAPTTISWYTTLAGEATRLSALQPEARSRVEELLRHRLGQAAEILGDAEAGPLVGAALHILSPEGIWVIDGQPAIIDWGMMPEAAQQSRDGRDSHFAATLGRFLSLAAAPAISAAEWRDAAKRAAPAAPAPPAAPLAAAAAASSIPRQDQTSAAAAPAAPAPTAPAPMAPATVVASVPVVTETGGRWRWVPLVLLLASMLVLLVWLLLPGTLLYPPPAQTAVLDDEEALALARDVNRSLEARAEQLRRAAEGAVCTLEGELLLPDGRTPIGTAPAQPGTAAPTGPLPGQTDALLPPQPERMVVSPDAAPSTLPSPSNIVELLEQSTALVLAVGQDSLGHGTGFFISPKLLVTNNHVVEEVAAEGKIFVTSTKLGQLKAARLVVRSGAFEESGADFAVLEVQDAEPMPYYTLRDSVETMKLQNVIAAGYPGVVLETDVNFEALLEGDFQAIPQMVVTQGIVNVEQRFGPQTRAIVHTATISPGNSGGPLVDSCGRVVGVNTFGRLEEETMRRVNFALDSGDLLKFLAANGITAQSSTESCQPAVIQAARVQAPPVQTPPVQMPAAEAPGAGGEGTGAAPEAPADGGQ